MSSSRSEPIVLHAWEKPTLEEVNRWHTIQSKKKLRDQSPSWHEYASDEGKIEQYRRDQSQQQHSLGPMVLGRQHPDRYRQLEKNHDEADAAVIAAAGRVSDAERLEAAQNERLSASLAYNSHQARIFVWGNQMAQTISRFRDPSMRREFDNLGRCLSTFDYTHPATCDRFFLVSALATLEREYPRQSRELWESEPLIFQRALSLIPPVLAFPSRTEDLKTSKRNIKEGLLAVVTSDFPAYEPHDWNPLVELPSEISDIVDQCAKRVNSHRTGMDTDKEHSKISLELLKVDRLRYWAQERANQPAAIHAEPSDSKGNSVLSKFSSKMKIGKSSKNTETKDSERSIPFRPRQHDPEPSSEAGTHFSGSELHIPETETYAPESETRFLQSDTHSTHSWSSAETLRWTF